MMMMSGLLLNNLMLMLLLKPTATLLRSVRVIHHRIGHLKFKIPHKIKHQIN
jgi:hypothetical protein